MFKFCCIAVGLFFAGLAAGGADPLPAKPRLLLGGDISMLLNNKELGAIYRDDGKEGDLIQIMMDHGCNCFRLRLFVDPVGKWGAIQDLDYTLKLAKRIKKAKALLLLDIHYSDTWADPEHQTKPAAWKDLDFQALEKKVEDYTSGVIERMKNDGCLPDIVQIGNETVMGFLWPEGHLYKKEGGWRNFSDLMKAGIRGVKKALGPDDKVEIMIHIPLTGAAAYYRNIGKNKVDYDIIGLSYYPQWHGDTDGLRQSLKKLAEEFNKDIVVVETAYVWRKDDKTRKIWDQTAEGQKKFLEDVINAVHSVPNGHGRGVIWWHPESNSFNGQNTWMKGNAALFGPDGSALPALDAFQNKISM